MAREPDIVTADAEDLQGFQMPFGVSGVDSEEAGADLAVIGRSAQHVNEAVVCDRHCMVEQIGRRIEILWFDARPRAIAVAEEPQFIRGAVIAEAAPKHDKAAGNGGCGALVERRWIMILKHILY